MPNGDSDIKVSIVIVTLNRDAPLCSTIQSYLPLLKERPDAEVIVVDQSQGHDQTTSDFLAEVCSQIRLFQVSFKGTTKARNFGTAQARGLVVIFTDDDVEPHETFLENHLHNYQDPSVIGIAGSALAPDERQKKKSDLPRATVKALMAKQEALFNVDFPYDTFWATGCNMSFRRQAIIDAGGFDESFYGSAIGEEPEFCYRLLRRGGRLVYCPQAVLTHFACPSGGSRDERQERERVTAYADNVVYLFYRQEIPFFQALQKFLVVCKPIAFRRKAIPYSNLLKRTYWLIRGIRRGWNRCHRPPLLRSIENGDWDVAHWHPLGS